MTDPNEERNKEIAQDIYKIFSSHSVYAPEAIEILLNLSRYIFEKMTETLEPVQKKQILEQYIEFMREWV